MYMQLRHGQLAMALINSAVAGSQRPNVEQAYVIGCSIMLSTQEQSRPVKHRIRS